MMKKRLAVFALVLAASSAVLGASKETCLQCHGPYDALIGKKVEAAADPAPVNPHQYIPHAQTGTLNEVWECTMCHEEHALGAKPKGEATIEACFSCHHQKSFAPSDESHGKR